MAILKETNMWFILIVVFAYMMPLTFSGNVAQVCRCEAGSETCSTFHREPRSSLDVDFAFCISLEAPALHGEKYSAVQLYDFTKIKCLNAKVSENQACFLKTCLL